jgi:hypothetical protein
MLGDIAMPAILVCANTEVKAEEVVFAFIWSRFLSQQWTQSCFSLDEYLSAGSSPPSRRAYQESTGS